MRVKLSVLRMKKDYFVSPHYGRFVVELEIHVKLFPGKLTGQELIPVGQVSRVFGEVTGDDFTLIKNQGRSQLLYVFTRYTGKITRKDCGFESGPPDRGAHSFSQATSSDLKEFIERAIRIAETVYVS
tara:strand:+ start:756 stop:1139 length:384 start_codon:yes stop_codon:yes gene_type:complete